MLDPEVFSRIAELQTKFADITTVIDLPKLEEEIAELEQQSLDPNLWDDQQKAQSITSGLSHRQSQVETVTKVKNTLDDVIVLADMAEEDPEAGLDAEVLTELEKLEKTIQDMEVQTLLSGDYDEYPAVLSIRAGAGGVDAADFALMLQRMYLRYGESHGYKVSVLETSYAEEAGIKSTTMQFEAPFAFGKLSVEAGTHRLVRISPFNAAGKRQTSFAAVEVIPLMPEAAEIEIPEADIRVDVYRSSGPGGQSVNTTDSAVRITHLPTGTVVSMQNEKSQIQNRAAAMRVLQSRLLLIQKEEEAAKKKELKGSFTASWGDQMRSYVLAPYQMVKDLRTEHEVGNPQSVFDGDLESFITAGIRWRSLQR